MGLLGRLRRWRRRRRRPVRVWLWPGAAIVHPSRFGTDVVEGDSSTLGVRDGFIVVIALGIAGDDVPGVQQSRQVAEHAQQNVDERVTGADAGLDPN